MKKNIYTKLLKILIGGGLVIIPQAFNNIINHFH